MNLKTDLDLYYEIFSNMQVGITIWKCEDLKNPKSFKLIGANRAASEALGVNLEKMMGQYLPKAFPAVYDTNQPAQYLKVVTSGVPKDFGEVFYADSQIHDRTFTVKTFPLPDDCIGFAFENITNRKQIEADLREMGVLFQNTFEGIARIGKDGTFVSVNKAFADMLGYSVDEFEGIHWKRTITPFDRPRVMTSYQEMLAKGKGEYKARALRKDGSVFWKHDVITKLYCKKNNFNGHYCFSKDITKQKHEEALEIKSELISMVSHELRTPLHSIREGIGVILEGLTGTITAEQGELLMTAKHDVDRLVRLVNNVLDFQKLESEVVEFDMKENDIHEVIDQVKATMSSLIQQKRLEVELYLSPNVPKMTFDRDKVLQVLVNIVHNAIKFTDQGKITIETQKVEDKVFVSVSDTGVGLKEEDFAKVFRVFGQSETGKVKVPDGTGLGLAISKKIVEEHGGTIWVDSEFGEGCTFSFCLPIHAKPKLPEIKRPTGV